MRGCEQGRDVEDWVRAENELTNESVGDPPPTSASRLGELRYPWTYLPINSSLNWGFNAGARLVPHLFAEFMWNRQTTTLSAHDIPTNQNVLLTNNAHLDMYQGSLLYEIWASSKVRPYVVGGIGFTHFDSHGILSFSDRFSYNLGGGVKYLFAPHLALRAEMRWSPSRTTSSKTTFCDPFLGCFVTPISNHAEQGQANIGLEFRF